MDNIEQLEEFLKALKELDKSLRNLNKELEGCPNGKGAVLKTV